MKIAVVNQSTDARVTQVALVAMAAAVMKQLATDFAGWWESQPVTIGVFADEASVPKDYAKAYIVDTLPDAPDALAYHTIDAEGRIVIRVGVKPILDNGGTMLSGSNSVSAAFSHECLEANQNPYVVLWADTSAGDEQANEVADPVEGDSYEIDGVSVSNFVGPRYFDTDSGGPFDFMGKLSAPFTMSPGGYKVVRTGGPNGSTNEVFGDAMPQWKRELKSKFGRVRRYLSAT